MNTNYHKSVFVLAAKESYEFLDEYLEVIKNSYNLNNCNIIMPYEFEYRDLINMKIDCNSQNFLIESDEYVRNLDNFNLLNDIQIQDLRILESKKRAYKSWLNQKLSYSKTKIPTVDICLIVHADELNRNNQKELRDETNIARQLNKKVIMVQESKIRSLNEKIMILKQKNN